jgi:Tol biopolymer transport system component
VNRTPAIEPLEQRRLLAAHFSEWSAPVSLGPVINSTFNENSAAISHDGRSLYFISNRPGGFGRNDIWVSQRKSVDDPWGEPANLGPTINTNQFQGAPFLSRDGHWLFFIDDGRGGFGLKDLFVSWRADKHDDFAWQPPVNLGPGVNSASDDLGPAYFEDDDAGTAKLYFTSDRPGGQGLHDIYVSERAADGTFGPAALVPELNSSANEQRPTIRRDGLEAFLFSDRTGGSGGQDLWTSTRSSTGEAWSTPTNLGPVVNAAGNDSQPHLSPDGLTLFLTSDRPGSLGGTDLYVTTRTKLTGKEFAATEPGGAVFPGVSGADTGGDDSARTATSLLKTDTEDVA